MLFMYLGDCACTVCTLPLTGVYLHLYEKRKWLFKGDRFF